jgi:N12 class adenine-specific DNA methylase/predicted ABC-type ATPase
VSIVDPPRPNGLQINVVVVDESKAGKPKWNENEHPRDRVGRFIETGAEVRIYGGGLAKVLRNVGGGRIEIQRADGSLAIVHRNYLTVTKHPDGSPVTKHPERTGRPVAAVPAPLPVAAPSAGAVELRDRTEPVDVNTEDIGDGLEHFLKDKDPDLAARVRSVSADYQAALANAVPDDEADERARLMAALDEVDQKYADDRRVQAMSTALRAEALHEPEGAPEEVAPAAPTKPTPSAVGAPGSRAVVEGGPARSAARAQALAVNFEEIGRQAHIDGRSGMPALDPQVSEALRDLPVGSPESRAILEGFNRGWQRENLAAPVDEDAITEQRRAPETENIPARQVNAGDVLNTPLGRVVVVGQPQKQPNGSFALTVDRENGADPVVMTMGSRDRTERVTRLSPPPTEAADAAPADAPAAPETPKAPEPRKYRTSPTGAREAAYAAEIMESDGYESGLTVDGWHVTVTSPNDALFAIEGVRDVAADNATEDQLPAAERRRARVVRDALDELMDSIRKDSGITGKPQPSRAKEGVTPIDAPKPKPEPVKPERRPIDGFTPAESALLRNTVEDHAAMYYGGPLGMNRGDTIRYVSEAHLKDLAATHGWAKVQQSVDAVIAEDESVLTRSQADRDQVRADRLARLDAISAAAGAAAQAGNWDPALAGLDEMESIDPTYRPAGLAIDDLRTRIRDMAPPSAPVAAPDLPEPVNAPDAGVPDADAPAAGTPDNAPETPEDAPPGEAPAPAVTAAPRRFATVEAVRQWLRGPGAIPEQVRGDKERTLTAQRTNARIASDPRLRMSAQGRLMVHRNPEDPNERGGRGGKTWRISAPGNGMWLGSDLGSAKSEREALDLANKYEAHVDADGNPVPFDAEDIKKIVGKWTDAEGTKLPTLLRDDRRDTPTSRTLPSEWNDEWAQGRERETPAPAPAAPAAASKPQEELTANQYAAEAHQAFEVGDREHALVEIANAERVAPARAERWRRLRRQYRGLPAVPLDTPLDENGDVVEEDAPEAAVNVPPAAPSAPEPQMGVEAEPDSEDEAAVPPVEVVETAPTRTTTAGTGRWKIPPVEVGGDPEAAKIAMAAGLRAAARASDSPEDRAALNWAARQLVPPKPRAAADPSKPRAPRRSPQQQARAQADGDVVVARRARKPPVSAEARMQALADLADELDRLGLGSVTVAPSAEGGGSDGGSGGGGTSLVGALRSYVSEYKKRRAQVDAGAAPVDSGDNEGGTDGAPSDAGGGALPQVPAEDVRGTEGPGEVLPESGDGSGAADRRPDGPASGGRPGRGGVLGEGGPAEAGPVERGGTGDAGDGADRPGDGADGEPAGQRVPDAAAGEPDAGRRGVDVGDGGLPDGFGGPGGDAVDAQPEPVAEPEPERPSDAGVAAEGVTEDDQPAPVAEALPARAGAGQDFAPRGMEDLAPSGKVAKLNANLAALRTLRTLQAEDRPATPAEQVVMAKWSGWGGLPDVFDDNKPQFAEQRAELRGLLSDAEWREAQRNTLNAHYTDARVVQALWKAVGDLGFDGGRVLEPGSGSGTFIGFAPDSADMVGVELDSTTAALSAHLYPSATIRNESFADTNVPDGSFDMTIGNVPFGKFNLTDRRHNPDGESMHNHFILKSLDLTRPGGLVAVLTSRYTLDSQDSGARRKMAEKGDLVGAVRLPTGSHQRASGTDVIEDILIFRRRPDGAAPQEDQSWIMSTKKDIDDQTVAVNDYWDKHPENVLGEMHSAKGQYGTGDLTVRGDRDMTDLPAVLAGIVEAAREDDLTAASSAGDEPRPELVAADESRHEGHLRVEPDGSFTQAVNGGSVPFEVSAAQRAELTGLVGLRETLSALLDAEASSPDITPEITGLRADLNRQYDAYVAKFGPVNRFKLSKTGTRIRPKQGGFRRDPMSAIVRALETYDASTGEAKKASIFTKRAVAPRELSTTADNPADAIALSLDTYGDINLPAIAGMLGVDEDAAREQLGTLVFEEPPTHPLGASPQDESNAPVDPLEAAMAHAEGLILGLDEPSTVTVPEIDREAIQTPGALATSPAYLSGNVRRKLEIARAAAALDPRFQANVTALEAVIPPDLGADEIDGRLGAAWIDTDTVGQFLRDLHQEGEYSSTRVSRAGSIWTVTGPNYGNLATEVWGTDDRSASQLVQSLLEQRPIKITRKVGDKTVPDLEATLAAQAKAEAIQERFTEWLWEDADRAKLLQRRYNDRFNALVLRKYDGSTRKFPGMAETWKPHPHVKDAVDRIVNEPTALLAHVVGAGKTAEMVMGAAELKRLGMARKPSIIVPNHMLEQFTREYLEIYPQAKLLSAGSEDLQGDGRREFVGRAATGDWDAVILTQGAFESIPMSREQQEAYIEREMATMRAQLYEANAALREAAVNGDYAGKGNQEKTVKKMEAALLRAEEALKKKLDKTKDVGVTFEQTGIDYMFVDEAHGYSNLRTLSNIQAAGTTGSDRATDLHMKMEYLRKTSQSGRVATFATGTPIRNTVTQAYIMQRFLRPDLLEEAGIASFDQWAGTFGSTVDEMELKPEGTGFRQTTRFAKFRNVPELLRMFHTFADVKMADDLKLPTPNLDGGKAALVVVPSSDALAEYIGELGERADAVRNGAVEPEVDNMLKISGDGRKAALSMKLVGGDHEPGKIEAAADKIAGIWEENKDNVYTDPKTGEDDPIKGALQIVFLDIGTPGSEDRWNGYTALKQELVARGLDPATVRFVHEAKNDAQKAELFAAARSGRISVLIGSSEKMGVGTNMQRRAIHLHHLDAPWRPADVEQRDGRIMRQGNLNPDVGISRYVTEGSFDAYMWQTLERKAKFINQIMKGSLDVREIEDIGDTAMSYAEIKALATGNPDLLDKAKYDTQLVKLARLERTHNRVQSNLRTDIVRSTANAQAWESHAAQFDAAIAKRVNTRGEAFTMTVGGRKYNKRSEAVEALTGRMRAILDRDRWGDAPERDLGTIGGFDVTGQVAHVPGGGRVVIVRFSGVPGEVTRVDTQDLNRAGIGLATRLESYLEAFEAKRDRFLDSAANARVEVARMEERVGHGFARADELAAVRMKAERINLKIQRTIRRQNGEDVPFDPRIDTDQFDPPLTGAVTAADLRAEVDQARGSATPVVGDPATDDTAYAAHTANLEASIGAALKAGMSTDKSMSLDGNGQVWTAERATMHKAIVDDLYAAAAGVPNEGKALIAGGLGGAGKSTVLGKYAGVDTSQYITVNPDDIKEIMAARGMIPEVDGLSPMEASPLVHEEASHMAQMLAQRAYSERKNIIWDITMSGTKSVVNRIATMRAKGYDDLGAVFVDIPVETSVERALARHRRGLATHGKGAGYGGRYVPPSVIRQNSSAEWSSANRGVFEGLRDNFDHWQLYDNSGQAPQFIAGSTPDKFGAETGADRDRALAAAQRRQEMGIPA